MATMDEAERQLWCKAWRFLKEHGDKSDRIIEREIEQSLKNKDSEGARQWREISIAVDKLGK
jgi:hypothetical protein